MTSSTAPELSVVLPAYNGERFVRAAVESVLAQTFRDFELIVVDDGSTDGTPAILRALQDSDSRLVVHRHERNSGLRAALNTGCRLARGTFVAKMSHDDINLPERFSQQVSFLRANPQIGVVGCAVQIIDERDHLGSIKHYPSDPALVAWSMLFVNVIAHPAVMMRRELLVHPEAYPPGCLGGTEDYALFSQLSRTSQVANLAEVLLLYRSWGGNMTHTRSAQAEDSATGIATDLARAWGIEISRAEAVSLRELSREQFPTDPQVLKTLASVVRHWTEAVSADPRWNAGQNSAIARAAAVKLILIASLSWWRSPRLAFSSAAAAMRLSSLSPLWFTARAGRVLFTRIAERKLFSR